MPLLVIVDPLGFSRGWMGSAERYFQVARALRELGWDVAVVARRDNSRATEEVDTAFAGTVVRTPFGTVPTLVNHRGLGYIWWLARTWSGAMPGDDVWATRLARWADRYKAGSPLASADLLCAVTYHYWRTPMVVRTMAQELGIPYWIDIQDPLKGTTGPERPSLSDEQLAVLQDAKQIVTTTTTYTEQLRQILPSVADKIGCLRLTHNASTSSSTDEAPPEGRLVLLHAGYLNGEPNRSAIPLLRAMVQLYEDVPSARGRVTLRLMGEGKGMPEAAAQAGKLGVGSDLECLPPVRPEALRHYLDTADVLCILKAATIRRDLQIPGKTYDYLFTNKPILATTFPGELADIIEATGSGFAVDPGDTTRLASVLEQLLDKKLATGSVALERDVANLSPYSFDAFRGELGRVLAACLK